MKNQSQNQQTKNPTNQNQPTKSIQDSGTQNLKIILFSKNTGNREGKTSYSIFKG